MFSEDRGERDYHPGERRRFQSEDRGPNGNDRPRHMLTRERLERQVYCHNVPFRSSWQDLKDFMRSAGEVEHVKILEGPTGRSRGCAVVTYLDKDGARKAVETLHGMDFQGRSILVREERTASFLRASTGGDEPTRYRSNYRGRYDEERHFDDRGGSPRDRPRFQQSYRRENDHYQRERSPPRERGRYYQRSRSPPRSSRHHRSSPPGGEGRDYRPQRDSRRSYHDNRYDKEDNRRD